MSGASATKPDPTIPQGVINTIRAAWCDHASCQAIRDQGAAIIRDEFATVGLDISDPVVRNACLTAWGWLYAQISTTDMTVEAASQRIMDCMDSLAMVRVEGEPDGVF